MNRQGLLGGNKKAPVQEGENRGFCYCIFAEEVAICPERFAALVRTSKSILTTPPQEVKQNQRLLTTAASAASRPRSVGPCLQIALIRGQMVGYRLVPIRVPKSNVGDHGWSLLELRRAECDEYRIREDVTEGGEQLEARSHSVCNREKGVVCPEVT